MKHLIRKAAALLLTVLLTVTALVLCVSAVEDPYWAMQKAYNLANESGDPDAIVAACEDIIALYSDLADLTACNRLTTPIQKAKNIYEEQGRYDDVLRLMREENRIHLRRCELTGTEPDPHKPYWILQKVYNLAIDSGDSDAVLAACEDIIAFYSDPWDTVACDRATASIQKEISIYEAQGRYDDVLRLMWEENRIYLQRCELTGAVADLHKPYWILQKAYNLAIDSGNSVAILAACEDIIAFYSELWDITACDRTTTAIQKEISIYEAQGRFDDVLRLMWEENRIYLQRCELTGAVADPHKPYWILQKAYNLAIDSGNSDAIVAACEDIIAFYSELWDKTACDRVIPAILCAAPIYEEQGRFDDALRLYREYQRCYLTMGALTGEYDEQSLKYAQAMLDAYAYTNPEIFVHANTPADVPDYHAKNEPHAGTYVGMSGYYEEGLCDAHLLYVEFENEYAEWFSYLLPKTDRYRLQEVAWNTPSQYNSSGAIEYFGKIANGDFDDYVIENLTYLASLDNCGVLLRFGAEINEWSINETYAKNGRLEEFKTVFKKAFRHIHDLAEIYAPNVAMVYSPNDISNMYVSHTDFYPGDDCVDWVGLSAYGNRSASSTGAFGSLSDAYYKTGVYSNQLTRNKNIVETYGDRKPIMISECGFMYQSTNSEQDEQYAKEHMEYFFSYINMLFPQVKALFYFNTNFGGNYYCLFGEKEHNDNLADTFRESVDHNLPMHDTLLGKESGYTRLTTLNEKRDDLTLSLYAAFPGNPVMTATYTLDGKQIMQTSAAPYMVHIEKKQLSEGRHTLSVKLQADKTEIVENYVIYVSSDGTVRAQEADMTDVSQSNWAYSYVAYCIQEGFFDGMLTAAFEPGKDVTRGAFVTLLGRAAGIDPTKYGAPEFSDVDADADYAPYVTWAQEVGVTSGTGGGKFSPDQVITREQICTMLVRYCDKAGIVLPDADGTKFADDHEIDSWYQDGVYRAKTAGIISGKGGNLFDPNAELSRQEIAVILMKFHLNYIR